MYSEAGAREDGSPAILPDNDLRFPFNLRPLMAGWNALFHDATPYVAVATQSAEWNRGAYLVNGLGHCGACHTPRNALGAEQGGSAFLAGATIDGWEAPALTSLSKSPVRWDADALYAYLRHGHSPRHGVAGGPMAEVVRELQQVSDADVRAMATYLASFNPAPAPDPQRQAQAVVQAAAARQDQLLGAPQRMFEMACAACHHDGDGPTLLGANTPLALNSQLVSDRPDSPHLLVPKMKAAFHFAIAVNDDQRQPDAKDKLRQAFDAAKLPATIEVYPGTQHGWCVKDSAIYNEPQAERAWAAMLALYKERLA